MRILLCWCLKYGFDWARDSVDLSKIDGTARGRAGRTFTAPIDLNNKGETERAELAKRLQAPPQDVLREVAVEGLMNLKVHPEADLADDAARQLKRSGKPDDDLLFYGQRRGLRDFGNDD